MHAQMYAMLQDKLDELEAIADTSYTFERDGMTQQVPQIEWFQMEKRGSGWSTVAHYCEETRRVQCPCSDSEALMKVSRSDDTANLSKIKKYFQDFSNLFVCVVEEHMTAPTTVWQLVVWNLGANQRDALVRHLSEHGQNGETHNYHVALHWVNEIPPDVLAKWKAF